MGTTVAPAASREHVEHLPATPASARAARRLVTGALAEWGREDLAETAELLVAEVVTNAVFHAGTDIEVRALTDESGVRIEVHDGSEVIPSPRHYDDDAVTGRGLALVEGLASAWGIQPTRTGKVVWFECGDPTHARGPRPGASEEMERPPPTGRVRLLGLPAGLVHATLQYGDAVLRELMLLSMADELGDDVTPLYTTPDLDLSPILDAVEAALADPRPTVDLEVSLPLADAEPALDRLALVDEADRLAHEDRLLSPPAVPEVAACRRWLMTEIAVQLRGAAPSRWQLPPTVDEGGEWRPLDADEQRALAPGGAAVMVADSGNRIVFVSDAAGDLLGWEPEDLTGRRLTKIIPPDLREAHLAGFTRLQVTGEGRIIEQPVRVRALRKDGSELAVELLIDVVRRSGGHPAFRAVFR
jgi:PAS domain S-box-containing protein